MYGETPRGDPDDPLETLAQFPAEMLERGLKLLSYLEAIDWKWDLVTLLEQPETWLELVFALKMLGESFREQERKQKKSPGQ